MSGKRWNLTSEKRICNVCGEEFQPKSNRQKYCSKQCKWKYWNDKKPRKGVKSYFKAQEAYEKELTNHEKQICLGTLIGDGYLDTTSKGFCLALCHGSNQYEYIKWKKKQLPKLIHADIYHYQDKKHNQYHVKSISHPFFVSIHDLLYKKNGKQVSTQYLNKLDELGLSVWYMDDGSYNPNEHSKQITISTEGFGEKGNLIIKDWLLSKWNISSTIIKYTQSKRGFSSKKKQQFKLMINKTPALDFFNLIKNHIPLSMCYKLPDKSSNLSC